MAVKNDEKDFFVSLCLRARNDFNGSAQGASPATAGRVAGVQIVQNGFVVVPSVPDGGSECLSQSATPEHYAGRVSRMSRMFLL